jgi:hypothetical protein
MIHRYCRRSSLKESDLKAFSAAMAVRPTSEELTGGLAKSAPIRGDRSSKAVGIRMENRRRNPVNDDTDSSGSASPEGDAAGEVELNEKELGKALTKALDHFFASLELLSGTSLEFAGQEDERSQPIDDVTSWLFREEDEDDAKQQP